MRAVRAKGEDAAGVHAHDDFGTAVATSLAAVHEVRSRQGTINGYGERCGTRTLLGDPPGIELKLGLLPAGGPHPDARGACTSWRRSRTSPGRAPPYVGKSAFAHKGGIHVAAMRRNVASCQHVVPELVGNQMRASSSRALGRGNLLSKAEELRPGGGRGRGGRPRGDQDARGARLLVRGGRGLSGDDDEAPGPHLPAAVPARRLLRERRAPGGPRPPRRGDGNIRSISGEEVLFTAAEDRACRRARRRIAQGAAAGRYPRIGELQLVDYKVRILDGKNGTAATTRVLVDVQHGKRRWSTVGASPNIIEASWRALGDALEYGLTAAADAEGSEA